MNDTTDSNDLVDSQGQVRFGIFSQTPARITRINGRDADYRTPMGRPASTFQRHFHYKQFQYFGIVSPELLIGCALADTAWLGIAFVYVFEPASGRLREFTFRSPLSRALTLSDSPLSGDSHFHNRQADIRLGYRRTPDGGQLKTCRIKLADVSLDATLTEPVGYEPMSLCTRTGVNGWVYANKVAGLPVTGRLHYDGRTLELAELDAHGHHDFSAGYMRRETFWNWACLSGTVRANGQPPHTLGLNLSCGVNETSFTENCLWLDGKQVKVDTVAFEYHRDDLMAPWRVVSQDGQVDLTFHPMGNHREHMQLGLFASNFNQLFGHFQGRITLHNGPDIAVDGLYGFVEEQYAKW